MIEVYDKKLSADGLMRVCLIVGIPCLLCSVVVISIYSNEEIGQSFLLKTLALIAVPPAGLIGIIRIFKKAQSHGSIGETSYLRIQDGSISFLHTQIRISEIESIIIRIRHKEVQDYFSGNNHLEIRTRFDKHVLGLLIGNDNGIESVEELIKKLEEKKIDVIYENYL